MVASLSFDFLVFLPAPVRPPPAGPACIRAWLSFPTSYPVRLQMRTEISALYQRLKTHVEAMTMTDKIVVLLVGRAEAGDLALECLAPPPAYPAA